MTAIGNKKDAIERLQMVLDETDASKHIQADRIAGWLDIDHGLGLGIDDSMKILSGLIRVDILMEEGTIDKIMSAMLELYNSINARDTDLKRERILVEVSKFKIPPDDWVPHYSKAMELLNQGRFLESSDEFNTVFRMMLEEPTTRGDLFRIFYNTSLANFLGGRPDLGELCLNFSLQLNPNYPLAREKMKEIERGEADEYIQLGIMKRIQNGFEKDREVLNPERYSGRSERSLVKELEDHGISFSREELIKASKEGVSQDEIIRALYTDRIEVDSPIVDDVWGIANKLWDMHCKGEPVAEKIIGECYEIEDMFEKNQNPSFKKIFKHFIEIEKIVYCDKEGLIEKWSDFGEYSSSNRHTLIDIFMMNQNREDFRNRFLRLCQHLYTVLGDPIWKIPALISSEGRIEELRNEMMEEFPHFYLLHFYLHLHYLDADDIERAHISLLDAIEVVEKNRKGGIGYKWNSGSNTSDMDHVYSILEELYENFEVKGKRSGLLKKGIKTVGKLRKSDEQKIDDKINEMMMENVKKGPVYKYMEFVEKLDVDFSTEEDAEAEIIDIDPLGREGRIKKKKIGRNKPCPCGSGKKYKHCCLRYE